MTDGLTPVEHATLLQFVEWVREDVALVKGLPARDQRQSWLRFEGMPDNMRKAFYDSFSQAVMAAEPDIAFKWTARNEIRWWLIVSPPRPPNPRAMKTPLGADNWTMQRRKHHRPTYVPPNRPSKPPYHHHQRRFK